MMEIIPAVDIMKGKVVRLQRGDPKLLKSYQHLGDPITLAKRWEDEGAKWIHVIDLDAALGLGSNFGLIRHLSNSVGASVQVGGGIRNLAAARNLLNEGVKRIILGSLAFRSSQSVCDLVKEFGSDRIIVALDNLAGRIMVDGWKKSMPLTAIQSLEDFKKLYVKIFLVTCISHDGTLNGPDLKELDLLCRQGVEILAAGGIGRLEDLLALKTIGVNGAVIGRALYDGIFTLGEAFRMTRGELV